jgi:hypothetical protein
MREWSFTLTSQDAVRLQPSITLRPKHGIEAVVSRCG